MRAVRCPSFVICSLGIMFLGLVPLASGKTLCVNPGAKACYKTIQSAVNAASANDIVKVSAGTYSEEVKIGKPLSILGSGAGSTLVDAANLAHGFFVDGYHHAGLNNVTISGFTVENALYEGILIVSASDVIVRNNTIKDNDSVPGVMFSGALTGCPNQPGSGTYETDETGDCGGAIHLVGAVNVTVSDNYVTGNADGVLISDETRESRNNLLIRNIITKNPLECGIVLASHPRAGTTMMKPPLPAHYGVNNNTVAENVSSENGVKIGGAGAGLFSDGSGQGTVAGNVIIRNKLTGNGLGGVALHTHVGPAFGLPADNFSGNKIIGNFIAGNLADAFDTATPGPVGININSGDGASPVRGTVIAENVIWDEAIDIAVNTPAEVDIHLNDLLGGKIGVGDVCALDASKVCTGTIDATENFWGCEAAPGGSGCTTVSGSDIRFAPWLSESDNN
jgi:parallel beta-helix repeat protein